MQDMMLKGKILNEPKKPYPSFEHKREYIDN